VFKTFILTIALVNLLGAQRPGAGDRLANESSPYLQHARSQPVDWHLLNDAAFAEARSQKKPLLIDVGAVWCGYCNTMDRESYSQKDVASFINQNFVPVKVDYDAKPEQVRQLEKAQALANLPAGIPLIMLVTPEGKLFAGGTYFPARKTAKDNITFMEMLQAALQEFKTQPSQIQQEGVDLNWEKIK
jgi:uncharacterized protein YyaL (SSP411 family)